jgi:hypothetical protein
MIEYDMVLECYKRFIATVKNLHIKNRVIYYKMSNKLFVPENREILENLRIGQIFSTYNSGISFSYNRGNGTISSRSENMVYLGEDTNSQLADTCLFLVVLKNGDTLTWTISHRTIERLLDEGKFVKSKRTKTVPPPLLQEIKNYYPNRSAAIENVKVVGNEVKFGEAPPIHLPTNVKNNLASFLAYFPKDTNQFPEDYEQEPDEKDETNEKDDQQNAGRRKKNPRKTKRNKKTKKSHKSKKSKRTRKSKKNNRK